MHHTTCLHCHVLCSYCVHCTYMCIFYHAVDTCEPLPYIDKTTVSYTAFSAGSTAQISCFEGHRFDSGHSDQILTCDGVEWSHEEALICSGNVYGAWSLEGRGQFFVIWNCVVVVDKYRGAMCSCREFVNLI